MSGVTGIFLFDGAPVNRSAVAQSVQRLTHRGPDAQHLWVNGSVGLGHCLLKTTPEARFERQPLVHSTERFVLTADVRLDNREPLAASLRWDKPLSQTADSELLLAAYLKWGGRCPEHLLGAFAFALWDDQKQQLLCARDHMGLKPLYCCQKRSRGFAFASEIKALFPFQLASQRINETRVADYLAGIMVDKTGTFYQDIRRLPPGHTLTISRDGKLRTRRYWSLQPHAELQLSSDAEYAEAFRDVFTEAVRCRLRTDGPVGSTLSGGLDSSSVACTARHLLQAAERAPLHTFSAIFPGLPEPDRRRIDERDFMGVAASQDGIRPHWVRLDETSPASELDRMLWHFDQPYFARNLYLGWSLNAAARDQGIRVMLDGLDGDNAVSFGLGRLQELAYHQEWRSFSNEAGAFAERMNGPCHELFRAFGLPQVERRWENGRWKDAIHDLYELRHHLGASPHRLFWRHILKPQLPASLQAVWRRLREGQPACEPPSIIRSSFADRLDIASRRALLESHFSRTSFTDRESQLNSLTYGGETALIEEADARAAAHGLEVRHPFLDIRLLRFSLSLPPDQKLKNGWSRYVLRNAMDGILPEAIRWRTSKANLRPNFQRNMLRYEQPRLKRLLGSDRALLAPYVDHDALDDAIKNKRVDELWPVLLLAQWLRREDSSSCYATSRTAPGAVSTFGAFPREAAPPLTSSTVNDKLEALP